MKLKNIVLGIVAIIMIAAIAIGITVAYLTATDAENNTMTVGPVDIELREFERVDVEKSGDEAKIQTFSNKKKPLLPAVLEEGFDYDTKGATVNWDKDKDGNAIKPDYTSTIWDPDFINNEVDKMVFVENTGKSPAYVRIFFAFEAGNFTSFTRFQDMIHINLNDTASEWKWEWNPALATSTNGGKYFVASATYKPILKSDEFTTISLSQISLDRTATNDDVLAFGEGYEVSVFAQAIQTAGFSNAQQAFEKGFGDNIPFKDFTFETGVKLKTALHYLNGEESEDKKITANVSTVIFGLNKEHKNIVSKYEPTFIGIEQEVPVYSYYVPNADDASKYDVYVLADSKIYTPKDSTGLFQEMTSLTTVKTTNMDVSRTENMTNMFRDCSKLTDIDTSTWNTERVQTFRGAFWACSSLAKLDVSKWNTANVTDMYATFYLCANIGKFDVGGWNVSNVTNMAYMFNRCSSITSLDVDSWNVGSVTTMSNMFAGCTALETLGVSNWDVSKVEDFQWFIACFSPSNPMKIKSLDVSKWNTGSATNMFCMFYNCKDLKSLAVSDWNVSKVTTLANMFEKCKALETLNLSKWNVSNVENMNGLFYECEGLTGLNLSGWNTAKVASMGYMFISCNKLTELDLSSWNTKAVKDSAYMFAKCSNLVTISVGDGWNMSNVTASDSMFSACSNLKGAISYNAANANDVTYANTETGYLTYKAAGATNP